MTILYWTVQNSTECRRTPILEQISACVYGSFHNAKLQMGDQNINFLMSVCAYPFHFSFFFSGLANGVKRVKHPDVSGMQRGPWYSTRNSDFFIKKVLKRKAHWIMTVRIIITVLWFFCIWAVRIIMTIFWKNKNKKC